MLEEELKEAKIAVNQLGGSIPADTVPERNAVLSEAQVLLRHGTRRSPKY